MLKIRAVGDNFARVGDNTRRVGDNIPRVGDTELKVGDIQKNPLHLFRGEGNSSLHYLNFIRCNRNAFNTTDTELNAIAAPATQGANSPAAAIGIPIEL